MQNKLKQRKCEREPLYGMKIELHRISSAQEKKRQKVFITPTGKHGGVCDAEGFANEVKLLCEALATNYRENRNCKILSLTILDKLGLLFGFWRV